MKITHRTCQLLMRRTKAAIKQIQYVQSKMKDTDRLRNELFPVLINLRDIKELIEEVRTEHVKTKTKSP